MQNEIVAILKIDSQSVSAIATEVARQLKQQPIPQNPEKKYMTVKQISQAYGIKEQTLRIYARRNCFESSKMGATILIDVKSFEAYIDRSKK